MLPLSIAAGLILLLIAYYQAIRLFKWITTIKALKDEIYRLERDLGWETEEAKWWRKVAEQNREAYLALKKGMVPKIMKEGEDGLL